MTGAFWFMRVVIDLSTLLFTKQGFDGVINIKYPRGVECDGYATQQVCLEPDFACAASALSIRILSPHHVEQYLERIIEEACNSPVNPASIDDNQGDRHILHRWRHIQVVQQKVNDERTEYRYPGYETIGFFRIPAPNVYGVTQERQIEVKQAEITE